MPILVRHYAGFGDDMPVGIHDSDIRYCVESANLVKYLGESGIVVLHERPGNRCIQ